MGQVKFRVEGGLNSEGNLLPDDNNNEYYLGSNSLKWKGVYLGSDGVIFSDGSTLTSASTVLTSGSTSSRPTNPSVGLMYFDTTVGAPIIYTSNGWLVIGAVPTSPTSVSASDSGSGRSYNNGSAIVSFTPGSVFGTSYTVTSSPGSYTATGSSSPITITGLQSSTQYTYSVLSQNVYGTSSASTPSSGVTATTVPQAPTIGTASDGNAQASVSFTTGATGGSTITGYTVTSTPDNITATGTSSPITITGLTNGTPYTFTVSATNSNGTSAASSASNSITPNAGLPVSGYIGWWVASDLPSTISNGTIWTNRGSGWGQNMVASSVSSATKTSWNGQIALSGTAVFTSPFSSSLTNGPVTMMFVQQWTSGVFGPSISIDNNQSGCSVLYSPGNPGYYGDGLYAWGNNQANPAVASHQRTGQGYSDTHYQRINGSTTALGLNDRLGTGPSEFQISTSHANQRIGEVILWQRVLTDSELTTMENYLRTKYGF